MSSKINLQSLEDEGLEFVTRLGQNRRGNTAIARKKSLRLCL